MKERKNRSKTFSFLALLMITSTAFSMINPLPTVAAAADTTTLQHVKCHDCGTSYDVITSTHAATASYMRFKMPVGKCDASLSTAQYAYFFAALRGSPAGLAGASVYCAQGSSVPVYGIITSNGFPSWRPSPGDAISASVVIAIDGSYYILTVNDATKGMTFTVTAPTNTASVNNAGCNVDLAGGSRAVFSLADFGRVSISDCAVTIGGVKKSIGAFGPSVTLLESKMVNGAGTQVLCYPSSLAKQKSFTVTWLDYGP